MSIICALYVIVILSYFHTLVVRVAVSNCMWAVNFLPTKSSSADYHDYHRLTRIMAAKQLCVVFVTDVAKANVTFLTLLRRFKISLNL